MNRISLPSFAKINWILKVLGRRPDGYHELQSVLQTIDLSDTIEIEARDDGDVLVEVTGRSVADGKDNLLYAAALRLRQAVHTRQGAAIRLQKSIPVGAGLGGGSGNVAVLLLALNQLWDCRLSFSDLSEIAAAIGSDVPFFLVGGTALVHGRGEKIQPLPDASPRRLILLYPDLELSTREAYEAGRWPSLDTVALLTRRQANNKIQRFCGALENKLDVDQALENDFDDVLCSRFPLLEEARKSLRQAGCRQVMLSGSGSTLIGLADPDRVDEAARVIARQKLGDVFLCQNLSRDHYRNILTQSGLQLGANFGQ